MWKCKRCGKCCKFIVIPVQDPVDIETEGYLDAHGIVYFEGKLLIPAVCQYLKKEKTGNWDTDNDAYSCTIHNDKFANCRLGAKKECKDAQRYYKEIEKTRQALQTPET